MHHTFKRDLYHFTGLVRLRAQPRRFSRPVSREGRPKGRKIAVRGSFNPIPRTAIQSAITPNCDGNHIYL